MISYFIFAACLINLQNFGCFRASLNRALHRHKRSVLKDDSSNWPDGIVPYMFDENFVDDYGKSLAREAMMRIQNQTCVRFIQKTNETNYLLIKRDFESQPCLSPVGYYQNGSQTMTFGNSCAQRPVMIHELLHVLGFFHEHQRFDRDNYIVVNNSNVLEGFESEFKLQDPNSFSTQDIPYDIDSIMHYKNFAFSKYINQTTNTVTFRKDYMTMYSKVDYKIALGSSTDLSPSDIKRVALRYDCSLPIEQSTTAFAQPSTTTFNKTTVAIAVSPISNETTTETTFTSSLKTSTVSTKSATGIIDATAPTNYIATATLIIKSNLTDINNQSKLLQPNIISTFIIILVCTFLL